LSIDTIKERLNEALNPSLLELVDESHKHRGHAGAKSGGGHYLLTISSDKFEGKTLVEKHQMIYDALGELMGTEIHALSIKIV